MSFENLDHLVYATADLEKSASDLAELFGCALQPGGSHTGLGTANYLMSLGGSHYLEVIGPDVGQPKPERPRPFGIDDLEKPGLVTFAVSARDIDGQCADALAAGYDPGPVLDMSRKTPEGELLAWRLTPLGSDICDGAVPFLIDWGQTPSPARTLPGACKLVGFEMWYPDVEKVSEKLSALGMSLDVSEGAKKLVAKLETPKGIVELS